MRGYIKNRVIIIGVLLFLLPPLGRVGAGIAFAQQQRPKIGLVLGGGGAKGAAHAGALQVIEEVGLPIDYLAGTSIGSIVGGLYACGYRSKDIQDMFQSQEWASLLTDRHDSLRHRVYGKDKDGVGYVFGFPVHRKGTKKADESKGIIRGDNVIELLDSMLGQYKDSMNFDKLPIPFRCVAANMEKKEEVVFRSGKLSTAMRSSMSIPGVFKAVTLDSLELLDGGMLNNLPVDVVKEMGADIVIAIDLTQNKHDDDKAERKNPLNIKGVIGWAIERPDLEKYQENREDADIYINPDLNGYGAASFKKKAIDEMIKRGYKAAKKERKALETLRDKLKQNQTY